MLRKIEIQQKVYKLKHGLNRWLIGSPGSINWVQGTGSVLPLYMAIGWESCQSFWDDFYLFFK